MPGSFASLTKDLRLLRVGAKDCVEGEIVLAALADVYSARHVILELDRLRALLFLLILGEGPATGVDTDLALKSAKSVSPNTHQRGTPLAQSSPINDLQ